MVNIRNRNTDPEQLPLSFRMPRHIKREFYKRYPERGERTKVLNRLVFLLLEGKISHDFKLL